MEPGNFALYGSISIIFAIFIYVAFYFFRNTAKERNWLMFIWVGAIAFAIAGWALIVKYVL